MNDPTLESTLPRALMRAENLPSLPAVAVEVLRLCEDERSSIRDLVSVVQRDPALAVRILKLANSSLFGLGHEVATIEHAAMVLGMKTVKLMSLSFSLAQTLPRGGAGGFDYAGYWRRSLLGAVGARALAQRAGGAWENEAFLAGLIANIGALVLAECLPEIYLDVVAAADGRWPTLEFERSRLGFHSADVAAALLRTWSLPDLVAVPVAYAARLAEIPADAPPEARRVAELLAVTLDVVTVLTDEDNGAALLDLEERAERLAGMPPAELEELLLAMEQRVHEFADMLAIEVTGLESHADVLARARARIVELSLDAAVHLRSAELRAVALEERNRTLVLRATTDALTGLSNRAAFEELLAAELARRRAGDVPHALGLILLDLDRFKRLNDRHGHLAGDAVLAAIGGVLRRTMRKGDIAARFGGEEFAVVLPETPPADLRRIAERVRTAIEAEVVRHEDLELRVTASLGGACVSRPDATLDAALLVKVADRLLYRAKAKGRNRSEVYARGDLSSRTPRAGEER